jgi:hypothetical protein
MLRNISSVLSSSLLLSSSTMLHQEMAPPLGFAPESSLEKTVETVALFAFVYQILANLDQYNRAKKKVSPPSGLLKAIADREKASDNILPERKLPQPSLPVRTEMGGSTMKMTKSLEKEPSNNKKTHQQKKTGVRRMKIVHAAKNGNRNPKFCTDPATHSSSSSSSQDLDQTRRPRSR